MKFTSERRERYLTLLETGRTITEACEAVGISRSAVSKWIGQGQQEGAHPDKAEFAARVAEIRDGPANAPGLTIPDLVKLLEARARKGDVSAIRLLLDRPWEKTVAPEQPVAPVLSIVDRLIARKAT